jgi:hypothetical protein
MHDVPPLLCARVRIVKFNFLIACKCMGVLHCDKQPLPNLCRKYVCACIVCVRVQGGSIYVCSFPAAPPTTRNSPDDACAFLFHACSHFALTRRRSYVMHRHTQLCTQWHGVDVRISYVALHEVSTSPVCVCLSS